MATKTKESKDIKYYEAVGRRKEAVARVRLYITGKDKTATVATKKIEAGTVVLNGEPVEKVFSSEADKKRLMSPLALTNNADRFAVSIISHGGGKNGQLEAIMLGIARALCIVDKDTNRPLLKETGVLTRDPRTRERRKVGTGGKARRAKQSPKR